MKIFCILLSAISTLAIGCEQGDNQTASPTINEPAGAQPDSSEQQTQKTTAEISNERGWTGTNESGRSTNQGISPGGANTRGTQTP